ncbi:MazG nucleotide pyrophosphohydrolase domain-containing protein [Pseudonocardia sp. ICBG601]|uniref:MazG nucleotide pyrophosphohydrolase domain-containing protein n=1 Tax=Pseudonocardia sp. ICBG601 TaxID=2846759 RepID=UPI0027E26FDD|nr:MazG nucleotide pyrophosphohydrolase domain-containing protein [Pseudonocardia sp. ICBG601]
MLFHARVATEHPDAPFGIDEVATGLVDKLVGRHPHVFAAGEQVATAADQDRRWDELKRAEKQRESSVDGVATVQPAVALAAKLTSRTAKARAARGPAARRRRRPVRHCSGWPRPRSSAAAATRRPRCARPPASSRHGCGRRRRPPPRTGSIRTR